MSDPYAPPGSRREPDRGQDARADHDARRGVGAPAGAPAGPPAGRTPPDPAGSLRTARLSLRFLLLVMTSLVALSLPWPWHLAAMGFLLAAGVVGVVALVVAAQAHLRASQLVALSIGLVMTGVMLLVQLLTLVFWQQTAERAECQRTAITASSLKACTTEYEQQIRSFGFLPQSTP